MKSLHQDVVRKIHADWTHFLLSLWWWFNLRDNYTALKDGLKNCYHHVPGAKLLFLSPTHQIRSAGLGNVAMRWEEKLRWRNEEHCRAGPSTVEAVGMDSIVNVPIA